ncbi:E3 ubiquitin-protein ligase RING1 [Sesamum alatum]|uniref:RING-type E3 ubiquitin transferase n=1 Tax=Sesamum alatum TaxID=300844 RepID=A0AAE1YBB9_9LAMI|nr:E3 ubiquitin-protein ligase RING1 [Sesamum alatum]
MSSPGIPGGGGGGAAPPRQYFCYQCERHVTITPPPSPTAELVCPNCHGSFLEESETAPPSNPTDTIPNPFFADDFSASAAFGGFPVVFSSSSAAPTGASYSISSGGGVGGFDDLSALFGTRSPNEFNPFAFLSNYMTNLQARGANIQLVFEAPGGGGMGGGMDFRLPTNLGDYFIGPGLEQLIQQLAENDPNRYGTPPASKSAVEGLPNIRITEEMLPSDSSQCAVCKDSFELNEEAKQMPCKHIYHKDCILPWLELHNSCPVCRYELPTDDPDYENRRTGQMNDNSNRTNNNSIGLGVAAGSQDNRDDNNNSTQTPRMVERRFRISLPWLFRGLGSPAETSSSGGGAEGNDGGNNSTNNSKQWSSRYWLRSRRKAGQRGRPRLKAWM